MNGARSPRSSLTPNPSPTAVGEGSLMRVVAMEAALLTRNPYQAERWDAADTEVLERAGFAAARAIGADLIFAQAAVGTGAAAAGQDALLDTLHRAFFAPLAVPLPLAAIAALVLALIDLSGQEYAEHRPYRASENRPSSSLRCTAAHRHGHDCGSPAIKLLFSHTKTPSRLPTRWSHYESASVTDR